MKTEHFPENLLTSLLAVNGWTAERVFALVDKLKTEDLADFDAVAVLPVEKIAERLARAGYQRGEYMNTLLASRLASMANVLSAIEVERLKRCLAEGRRNEVSETLRRINGVGPVVLQTFWALQGPD